jgi:hypothetical protein
MSSRISRNPQWPEPVQQRDGLLHHPAVHAQARTMLCATACDDWGNAFGRTWRWLTAPPGTDRSGSYLRVGMPLRLNRTADLDGEADAAPVGRSGALRVLGLAELVERAVSR